MAQDPRSLLSKLISPSVSTLGGLSQIGYQASLLPYKETGQVYGTLTGAKPSPKPFIVGFIPPDIPVNFVPVDVLQRKIGDVSAGITSPSPAGQPPPVGPLTDSRGKPGPPGLQVKTPFTVSAQELRESLINSYTQLTGRPPTDDQMSLIYSQIGLEIGGTGVKKFSVNNFNLGNVHAGGGQAAIGEPTPNPPKGGSYYLTVDYRGDGTPYQCYYVNYPTLQDATTSHLRTLFTNWPGTRSASNADEFNQALSPFKHGDESQKGRDYYETTKEKYLSLLNVGQSAYYKLFGGSPSSSGISGISSSESASFSKGNSSGVDTQVIGSVMTSGFSTDFSDPLGDKLGRNIQASQDENRKKLNDIQLQDIIRQIDIIRSIPFLILLINPHTFDRDYDNSPDAVKVRNGYVVHVPIPSSPQISSKGETAAQYVVDASGAGGITGENRINSLSYHNLLSLMMMYKNNGHIYFTDGGGPGNAGIQAVTMSMFIYYDNVIYIGSFDDFSVTDTGMKPFNMEYDFRFNVRYEVDVPPQVHSDFSTVFGSQLSFSPFIRNIICELKNIGIQGNF
jgi:hypothetical protein